MVLYAEFSRSASPSALIAGNRSTAKARTQITFFIYPHLPFFAVIVTNSVRKYAKNAVLFFVKNKSVQLVYTAAAHGKADISRHEVGLEIFRRFLHGGYVFAIHVLLTDYLIHQHSGMYCGVKRLTGTEYIYDYDLICPAEAFDQTVKLRLRAGIQRRLVYNP